MKNRKKLIIALGTLALVGGTFATVQAVSASQVVTVTGGDVDNQGNVTPGKVYQQDHVPTNSDHKVVVGTNPGFVEVPASH